MFSVTLLLLLYSCLFFFFSCLKDPQVFLPKSLAEKMRLML